jgi:hypothetical protein
MTSTATTTNTRLSPAMLRATGMELTLVAEGASMFPVIRAGDRLRIRCGDAPVLEPGALIAFLRAGELVVHRLIEIDPARTHPLYEQGDAVTRGSWIHPDDVIGVVVAINEQPAPAASPWLCPAMRLARRLIPWVPQRLRSSSCLNRLVHTARNLINRSHAHR